MKATQKKPFDHKSFAAQKEKDMKAIDKARRVRIEKHLKEAFKGIVQPNLEDCIVLEIKKVRATVFLNKNVSKAKISKIKNRLLGV